MNSPGSSKLLLAELSAVVVPTMARSTTEMRKWGYRTTDDVDEGEWQEDLRQFEKADRCGCGCEWFRVDPFDDDDDDDVTKDEKR